MRNPKAKEKLGNAKPSDRSNPPPPAPHHHHHHHSAQFHNLRVRAVLVSCAHIAILMPYIHFRRRGVIYVRRVSLIKMTAVVLASISSINLTSEIEAFTVVKQFHSFQKSRFPSFFTHSQTYDMHREFWLCMKRVCKARQNSVRSTSVFR